MRSITVIALAAVLGAAAPALAGGVTLSNPKRAKKVKKKKQRSGVTISSKSPVKRTTRLSLAPGVTASPPREPGKVLINVVNADLKTRVLPMFKKQAGIKVRYRGAPRKVTLRLTEAVRWEEALELVAQFTNTHVARDSHKGPILRDKWGGKITRDREFDDLGGQVDDKQRSVRASADRARAIKRARFRRIMPITRPSNIPYLTIGGNTVYRFGPRGGGARPYVAAPYVSPPRPIRPYTSGQPYVNRNTPARPYVSNNQGPQPYTSPPYVNRNRPAQPYTSPNSNPARPYVSPPIVSPPNQPRGY